MVRVIALVWVALVMVPVIALAVGPVTTQTALVVAFAVLPAPTHPAPQPNAKMVTTAIAKAGVAPARLTVVCLTGLSD